MLEARLENEASGGRGREQRGVCMLTRVNVWQGRGSEDEMEMNDLENVIFVVWLGWRRARWLCEKAVVNLVCLGK